MKRVRRVYGVVLALLLAGSMFAGEVYRLQWTQSPSTFLETQKVMARINGAPAVQVGADLLANVNSIEFEFATNAAVEWYVVSIGDNATTAESAHATFTAANQAGVLPATGLTQTFVRHVN